MGHKEFGELLAETRVTRSPDGLRWTQETLADASGLKFGTVRKIEQGILKKLNPQKHLEPLAEALELSELEKSHFYSEAGFEYRPIMDGINREQVRWLLEEHAYPAYALTPLWDFVAGNAYSDELYGQTPALTNYMNKAPLGANLLWVLFDDKLNRQELFGGYDRWLDEITRAIYAFRASTLRYIHSERYKEILRVMGKSFKMFNTLWETHGIYRRRDEVFPARPITTVYYRPSLQTDDHQARQVMTFLTVRVPYEYMGEEILVSVYVPTKDSANQYAELQKNVRGNNTNWYPLIPIE